MSLFALLLLAAASPPAWMAGCWRGQAGALTFEEHWTLPAGDSMMGIARTLKGERVVFSEFMRIDRRDGQLVYTPRIGSGTDPVQFVLKSYGDTEVTFENAAHDFPQRIVYTRNADELHARIEGTDRGTPRTERFPMKPVACK